MSEIVASTYEIINRIGAGGGGVIYLAYHMRLEKKVILKADKRKITTRPELLRREVDVLKELNHTYIPQVYDYFTENGIVYTVIDYIEGESLDKPLKRGETFSLVQVCMWARQILEALDYLHNPTHGSPPRGYVHSDIKPANIMKKTDGTVCLIDFNIALALGEDNAVGRSRGYASPEHYGLDFSSNGFLSGQEADSSGTEMIKELALGQNSRSRPVLSTGSSGRRKVLPDIRSDIYSLGATLYHLLSGVRPAEDAREVTPLSRKEFNPQIVEIISKAMNPNPDLRYQTAREMLDAFLSLKKNDIRYIRWKRRTLAVYTILTIFLVTGAAASLIGLRRMQTTERWLRITEDSRNLLQAGDRMEALEKIMQVYSEQEELLAPNPPPRSREILTEVLGVYDLADCFQIYKTVELPSAPLLMRISPEGTTAACIYSENLAVINLDNAEITDTFSADPSALAEVEYLNDNTIVYAGEEGITVYDVAARQERWRGKKATGIAVSGDGKTVAAVYRDETQAFLYDTSTGEMKQTVDFGERKQKVAGNDVFANPSDSLFCLNEDGSLLAISFADGTLKVMNLESESETVTIFDDTEAYSHYEGGFYRQYLAFSATDYGMEESAFVIINTETMEQCGGFSSEGYYFTKSDREGVIVGVDDILAEIDPETGDQIPLVDTAEIINSYARGGGFTAISSGRKIFVFDGYVNEISSFECEASCDLLAVCKDTVIAGSLNSPVLWIARYESHLETQIAVYDPEYYHDETRLSSDGKTIMLFSYDKIRVCDLQGNVIRDVAIPDAENVYDQQFCRDGTDSWLDVIYRDGCIARYSASNGELVEQTMGEMPDMSLYEEFKTSELRIESPLHGTPKVYDIKTEKLVCELEENAYLTYITEIDGYIIAQYMTTEHFFYGYLMDERCHILAYLPNLCDVLPDRLLFDYPTGNIRESKIYELSELLEAARARLGREEI